MRVCVGIAAGLSGVKGDSPSAEGRLPQMCAGAVPWWVWPGERGCGRVVGGGAWWEGVVLLAFSSKILTCTVKQSYRTIIINIQRN